MQPFLEKKHLNFALYISSRREVYLSATFTGYPGFFIIPIYFFPPELQGDDQAIFHRFILRFLRLLQIFTRHSRAFVSGHPAQLPILPM
jgi:hypothetical protein